MHHGSYIQNSFKTEDISLMLILKYFSEFHELIKCEDLLKQKVTEYETHKNSNRCLV